MYSIDNQQQLRSFIYFLLILCTISCFGQDSLQIGHISVEGNKKTKEHIILRELDINLNIPYSASDTALLFKRNRNKVFNTQLFNYVDFSYQHDTLTIKLEERWYIFPSPIFDVGDRNFNEWWTDRDRDPSRLIYGVNLKHNNFRGRNERINFKFQFGFIKAFQLDYRIPYLDKKQRLGLNIQASYSNNKTLSLRTTDQKLDYLPSENLLRERRKVGGALLYRPKYYILHESDIYYHHTTIADTVAEIHPNYLGDGRTSQQYFRYRYFFQIDQRDIQYYPMSGHIFTAEFQKLGFGLFDDINTSIFHLGYGNYKRLGPRWSLANILKVKVSGPKQQPYLQYQAQGFSEWYLRGYELYVIDGAHSIVNRNSLKWEVLNIKKTKTLIPIEQFKNTPLAIILKLHSDFGYVHNPLYSDQHLANGWLWGWGIGLDFLTYYDGVFRIEYSFDKEFNSGLYLHLGAEF